MKLKNKRRKTDDYRQLKTKLFFTTVLLVIGAVIIIWAIYSFFLSGRFANWMVSFFKNGFHMEYESARNLYQQSIRNYMEWFIYISIGVVFFILFGFYLNRFTKYFYEINRGIDELLQESATEIDLIPELSSTEKKLNTVRQTLEKRKLDAQLAEQRKNDLVVYLAHDLKTPLTSVIGYLTLLRDEPQISQELRAKYTGIALDKAERLETLINEFFDITRFNLTKLTLEPESVNLTRMLEQITFEFNPVLAEKSLCWDLHLAPDIRIVCDPDKLERVFDNLIRNAVNYSYPDTAIAVAMEQSGSQVTARIANHGKTIPPEKLERIFEQFFRLDTSRSSSTGGSGLGLAIAREIVELHGGAISAESHNEHIAFTVTLPLNCQKIV